MLEGVGKRYCGNRKKKNDFVAFPYIAADLSEEQNSTTLHTLLLLLRLI
jgi:hypothetical protein